MKLILFSLVALLALGGFDRIGVPNVKDLPTQLSWKAGNYDEQGTFMGGTELLHLVPHRGALYAGNGFWKDVPGGDPSQGAQILMLDSTGKWKSDYIFARDNLRLTALASVAFTTDGKGQTLTEPVHLLLAAPSSLNGDTLVYSKAGSHWTKILLSSGRVPMLIRAIFVHKDQKTGVDYVFVGSSPSDRLTPEQAGQVTKADYRITTGVFDSAAPGKIRWLEKPELTGYSKRLMAFADNDGVLHAIAGGVLYRREDGFSPQWKKVYTTKFNIPKVSAGLRGLTSVRNISGTGHSLLMALEGNESVVIRIDPADGYKEYVELDVINFLSEAWRVKIDYALAAYNDAIEITNSTTGRSLNLIGLSAHIAKEDWPNRPNFSGFELGGWFLNRDLSGKYELTRLDPGTFVSKPGLLAVRAIARSPFDRNNETTMFFGGYDAANLPAHNTAWILKGTFTP